MNSGGLPPLLADESAGWVRIRSFRKGLEHGPGAALLLDFPTSDRQLPTSPIAGSSSVPAMASSKPLRGGGRGGTRAFFQSLDGFGEPHRRREYQKWPSGQCPFQAGHRSYAALVVRFSLNLTRWSRPSALCQ